MASYDFAYITPTDGTLNGAQMAQANGSGRLVFPNRARKISDGTFKSWNSFDVKDPTMSECPGSPNPADYTDFVVMSPFYVV